MRQAFLDHGISPLKALEKIPTWDEWDPDHDRWYFEEGSL